MRFFRLLQSRVLLLSVATSLGSVQAQTASTGPQTPATPSLVDAAKVKALADANDTATLSAALAAKAEQPPVIVWYVVPPKVVEDNYGHNVANKYIMMDITVKNVNTENQLAIRSFAIAPSGLDVAKNDPYKNTDPDLVRGTIEKTQQVGMRNRGVQVVKTTGLMASGAAGFFKAAGPKANYNLGVDIFSNPFEKGIELIFPDTTIRYLTKWDANEVFKNGFIVEPGKEISGTLFFPIKTICSQNFPKPPGTNEPCEQGGFFHGPHYNPELIKQRIGKLAVLGQYVRIQQIRSVQ